MPANIATALSPERLSLKLLRYGLLPAVALPACFVMSLDPYQP